MLIECGFGYSIRREYNWIVAENIRGTCYNNGMKRSWFVCQRYSNIWRENVLEIGKVRLNKMCIAMRKNLIYIEVNNRTEGVLFHHAKFKTEGG